MPEQTHLDLLRQGVAFWNQWREQNPGVIPNFTEADLSLWNLRGVNFSRADLSGARLNEAYLGFANLTNAVLRGARLGITNLSGADLSGADLMGADLRNAILINTNLSGAVLTDCLVFGISIWHVDLSDAEQKNLIISEDPKITVDNLDVAQFIYLILNNDKLHGVFESVTSKVVLILGRFKPERKAVLDKLREALRARDYLPVIFDYEKPEGLDYTESVTLLARMSLFIVADLTEPSSIPQELQAIVPDVAVPVQPILEGQRPYSMFKDYRKYDWMLGLYRYAGSDELLANLDAKVIAPARAKSKELIARKNAPEE
jgi:hypothetical protein